MQSIPYRLVGGMRFYERMEIKDVVSYMKTSINRSDDVALKRIINVPVRGIGKTTVDRLEEIASQKRISLFAAIEAAIQEREFNAGTSGKLRRFVDLILDLESLAQTHGLEDFYHMLLDRTEYLNHIKKDDSPEAKSRVENLNEFDNAIAQFCKERSKEASLVSFLEEMALVSDADDIDQEVNSVTLMTLHVSKGLEFPFVFIVGMEENLFPSVRGEGSDMDDQIEEERRLAYVGITRAREQLWLTHTKMRRVWGQEQFFPPSRFLSELPKEMTQRQSASLGRSNQGEGFVSRFRQRDQNFDDHFENDSFESLSNSAFQSSFKKRSAGQDSDHEQSFPDYETESTGSGEFKKGMRVRHPTFGVGSIYSTEGSGSDQRVSVIFGDHTIKKFVTKYARLERV
jgi:DNA helicase-2/ATP-dependent DNA helicase PcrA